MKKQSKTKQNKATPRKPTFFEASKTPKLNKVTIFPIRLRKTKAYYLRGATLEQANLCGATLGLSVDSIPMCGSAFYECFRRAMGTGTPDDCAGCGASYLAFVLYDPAGDMGRTGFTQTRQEIFRKHIISKDNPHRSPEVPEFNRH